ncbi:MAG: AAA family ATPase [Desulfarculus sp.]|nr:AAA family ATPase [Desulfarculus sp.]
MQIVYVGSTAGHSGKNLLCLGLGRRLLDDAVAFAFCKPYGGNPYKVNESYTDSDAWLINETLGLGQTPEQCCPVVRTQDLMAHSLRHQAGDLMSVILATCQDLGQGKDLLLLAGGGTLASGATCGISGYQVAERLEAKVVLVDRYENDFYLDHLLHARDCLGERLLGVVINSLDQEMNAALEETVMPYLAAEGVRVFGRLPRDKILGALAVADLVEMLGGKLLCGAKFADRLATRFFIGAMQVRHASKFFGGVHDFACIVGGDRPDMQLAAIEGGAACLILTGNLYPSEIILSRAEEYEVPVLVVRDDTFSVAHRLERLREAAPLRAGAKVARGTKLVLEGVDWSGFYAALGLKV